MRVVERGIVYDGASHPALGRKSMRRTSVCRAVDGTLYVAFRRCLDYDSHDGHPVIMASTDEGRTWEERWNGAGEGELNGVPGGYWNLTPVEVEPGVLLATGMWIDLSSGQPWINPVTGGMLPLHIVHRRSTDGGRSWSDAVDLDLQPQRATTPCANHVVLLASGDRAQPFETLKEYEDPRPNHSRAFVQISHDRGETWPIQQLVAADPENRRWFWDQRLAVHPGTGQVIAMFWTHDTQSALDLDVHIAYGSPDARSWTVPVGTGLPGQHCQPVPVGGDGLVALYSNRTLPGIVASMSRDLGRTWERGEDLVVYDSRAGREPGAGEERSFEGYLSTMVSYHFGHPRAILLPDGNVFAVWYQGDDETISVAWARIALGE